MSIIEKITKQVQTIIKVKSIKGTSFVGVRNYTNKSNEVSNQTFLVGINYVNLLKNDLDTLLAFDLSIIMDKYPNNRLDVVKGYNELVASLTKLTSSEKEKELLRQENDKTIKRSDSMLDAFEYITKGLKAKDNNLYVYGLSVKKTILKEGVYKSVNSRIKTIIKKDIERTAKLRKLQYRSFKLGSLEELKLQGVTI